MNWKSPAMIVLYCIIGITILSFALISVVSAFAIVGSIGLVIVFGMLAWWSFIRYLIYKRKKADERLSDAYLYAEEQGNEDSIKHFTYDKKTERKLRWEKFNHLLAPLALLTLSLFSICLVVICIRIM